MTTPPSFPTLPGVGWPVKKTPKFNTLVAEHASGRMATAALYANPVWEFELTIPALAGDASHPGLGTATMQALANLFLVCQGRYGTFLYADPSDGAASAQGVWNVNGGLAGDGSTTVFTLSRALVSGGFLEPVGWVTAISQVTVAGSPTSAYSLTTPNTLTFTSAPASGAAIAWSGTYAFQCRFDEDSLELSEFMQNLWEAQAVKFRSVRAF
ncbi:MAG TPA: DUF2460 domain-containing protein [Roseiarcus sp.]|nr:DUF2460 domain-containing protein [Roseiarcus sp.]